jgi:PKD repeat protein
VTFTGYQLPEPNIHIDEWLYIFNDGDLSAVQNPIHTFWNAGCYEIDLRVLNYSLGWEWKNLSNYICVSEPEFVLSWNATPTIGFNPLSVAFVDKSQNTTAWYWEFGDTFDSSLRNISHTYTSAGVFTVHHGATNGSIWLWDNTSTITVNAGPPAADFSCIPLLGAYPLFVTCTDASTGTITDWNWSFGDGNVSILQNPTNTYSWGGSFDVNLTVCGPGGCDIELKLSYISAVEPTPRMPANVTVKNIPRNPLPDWTVAGFIDNLIKLVTLTFSNRLPTGPQGTQGEQGPAGIVKDSGSIVNASDGIIVNHTLDAMPSSVLITGTVPYYGITVSNVTEFNFTVSIKNLTDLTSANETIYWMASL